MCFSAAGDKRRLHVGSPPYHWVRFLRASKTSYVARMMKHGASIFHSSFQGKFLLSTFSYLIYIPCLIWSHYARSLYFSTHFLHPKNAGVALHQCGLLATSFAALHQQMSFFTLVPPLPTGSPLLVSPLPPPRWGPLWLQILSICPNNPVM